MKNILFFKSKRRPLTAKGITVCKHLYKKLIIVLYNILLIEVRNDAIRKIAIILTITRILRIIISLSLKNLFSLICYLISFSINSG